MTGDWGHFPFPLAPVSHGAIHGWRTVQWTYVFGSGTYTANGSGAEDLAQEFERIKIPHGDSGALLRLTLRLDARGFDHRDVGIV